MIHDMMMIPWSLRWTAIFLKKKKNDKIRSDRFLFLSSLQLRMDLIRLFPYYFILFFSSTSRWVNIEHPPWTIWMHNKLKSLCWNVFVVCCLLAVVLTRTSIFFFAIPCSSQWRWTEGAEVERMKMHWFHVSFVGQRYENVANAFFTRCHESAYVSAD